MGQPRRGSTPSRRTSSPASCRGDAPATRAAAPLESSSSETGRATCRFRRAAIWTNRSSHPSCHCPPTSSASSGCGCCSSSTTTTSGEPSTALLPATARQRLARSATFAAASHRGRHEHSRIAGAVRRAAARGERGPRRTGAPADGACRCSPSRSRRSPGSHPRRWPAAGSAEAGARLRQAGARRRAADERRADPLRRGPAGPRLHRHADRQRGDRRRIPRCAPFRLGCPDDDRRLLRGRQRAAHGGRRSELLDRLGRHVGFVLRLATARSSSAAASEPSPGPRPARSNSGTMARRCASRSIPPSTASSSPDYRRRSSATSRCTTEAPGRAPRFSTPAAGRSRRYA